MADTRHTLFDGSGAALYPGRWNEAGQRAIYAAQCLSGALLEVLVHLSRRTLPRTHGYIEIEWPDNLAIEQVDTAQLSDWNADLTIAREFGAAWYAEKRSAILAVPSIVVPDGHEKNYVINPDHPAFSQIKASPVRSVVWDERLFR